MRTTAAIFHVHRYLILYFITKLGHFITNYSHLPLMSNVYASIVCPLRADLLRKTQNSVDFSVSLRTVIQMSIDSTSHNASMSLIQCLGHCILGVQSQIEDFLEIEKAHQNGNSGVEGS